MRAFLLCLLIAVSFFANCQQSYLFVGTYTSSGSKGIYVYNFDAFTGKATWLSNTEGINNPSYLSVAPGGKFLYAGTDVRTPNGSTVSAFSFDKVKRTLSFINKQPSGGDNPAYVSVHKSGKWLTSGNYTGGNLSVFPINADGSLRPYSQLVQHEGKSVNTQRQEKPHVHATVFDPKGDFLFVPDLGIDKVMIYKFNSNADKPLTEASTPFITSDPGNGPRHFTFHPNKKNAYLIEELAGQVVAYKYKKGQLTVIQKIITHSDTAKGDFGSADIHVSPDGNFLYASNRGSENNIAIFSIEKRSGFLTFIALQSTLGIRPRNFVIDPSGKYLLAANQQTGNIVIFKRDLKSGLLSYTGEQIKIPEPVCLKMIEW